MLLSINDKTLFSLKLPPKKPIINAFKKRKFYLHFALRYMAQLNLPVDELEKHLNISQFRHLFKQLAKDAAVFPKIFRIIPTSSPPQPPTASKGPEIGDATLVKPDSDGDVPMLPHTPLVSIEERDVKKQKKRGRPPSP